MSELASVRAAIDGEVDSGPNEGARKAATARASVTPGLEHAIASLRVPRTLTRLKELVLFGALWAVGGYAVMSSFAFAGAWHWALRIGGTLVVALALHVIALLLHHGVHHTLFRHRAANRWISVLLGGCVLMSASAYQIPSYNLDRVHELVYPRLPRAASAPSYLGFLKQFVKQSARLDETPIGVVHRGQ